MKLSVINDPFPYIYVEDLYSEEELKLIWQELDYYQANNEHWFMGVDKTMGATENGKPMKQNTGFWLHDTFRDPNKSALARSTVEKLVAINYFDQIVITSRVLEHFECILSLMLL